MAKSFRIKDGKFLIIGKKFAVGAGSCTCCGDCCERTIVIAGLNGTLAIFNGTHSLTGVAGAEGHCIYTLTLEGSTPPSYDCEYSPAIDYEATLIVDVNTVTNEFSATLDDLPDLNPNGSQAFTPVDRDADGTPYNWYELYRECQDGNLEEVENEDGATISVGGCACPATRQVTLSNLSGILAQFNGQTKAVNFVARFETSGGYCIYTSDPFTATTMGEADCYNTVAPYNNEPEQVDPEDNSWLISLTVYDTGAYDGQIIEQTTGFPAFNNNAEQQTAVGGAITYSRQQYWECPHSGVYGDPANFITETILDQYLTLVP